MATPKLRFKEFNENWYLTSFQDLFTFKNGVNASKEQYGSGIKFINVLDIINNPNGITYESIIGSVDVTSKEIDKNLVQYGDVLFQRSSETREEVGQSNVYLNNEPVVFGGFVIRGSAQQDYDPIFINGLLKTDSLRDQITQLSGGSTRFNIGQDSLNKVSAYLPSKEEQTKIASFLSAVDEKISQLTQKHELLSQYKQGMMQKLFSRQIRFKADNGSEFGEWEETILSDVSDVRDGTHDSPKYVKQGYALITSKNLKNGKLDFSDINYISQQDYESISKRSKVDVGDIIFGMIGTIGNPVLLMQDNFAIKNVALIKQKNELLNIFLIHYLNSSLFDQQVRLLNAGNTQKFLALGQIRSLKILKPCLAEQTKIANFLSAIDQKIEVVAQQIEQAKQWKKGLLQQMFV